MTSAGRFVDLASEIQALIDLDTDDVGPELLPVRLAKAAARTLGVHGASLSLFTGPDMRVPIGASDEVATFAERLQFTLGQGPCFQAQGSGEMVFAVESVLIRSWPEYHRALLTHTPFHAVLSVPLDQGLQGMGALDLYFEWHDVRGVGEGTAFLVRPDGFVAWRDQRAPLDLDDARRRLSGALDTLLDRRPKEHP